MRLVICDDHQLLLEALAAALIDAGHDVVATLTRPEDAIAAVRDLRPDAALLDLSFPGESGLSVIGQIARADPRTRVVILSGSAEPGLVTDALARGAHGFVGKDRPVADIVHTLERALAGQRALAGRMTTSMPPSVAVTAPRRAPSDDPLWMLRFLTDREWQVMRCILDGQSTEQMAGELGVRHSTARTHVQNLLNKLGVHSRLQVAALMTAHGEALLRHAPGAP